MVIDDEPQVLRSLYDLFRSRYQVETFERAEDALGALTGLNPPVVMSDQRMPEMTGSEFLAKVRLMYPDTIRIILSGYADLKSITEAVNRGEIYKFLEKPWKEAALKQTLHEAFRDYEVRRTDRKDVP